MISALTNGLIFDGEKLLKQHAVLVDGNRIDSVISQNNIPLGITNIIDLKGNYLVPGFIDLQVNGGGGMMFNSEPTVDAVRTMVAGHRKYGTTGLLPTLITTSFDVMQKAIAAVEQAMAEGVPGVLGIHLGGAFSQ